MRIGVCTRDYPIPPLLPDGLVMLEHLVSKNGEHFVLNKTYFACSQKPNEINYGQKMGR